MNADVCPRCGFAWGEEVKFCPECGSRRAQGTLPASRKRVSVLFVDLVGSTHVAESMDPEALRSLLTLYFDTVSRIVWEHGGTVEKFIGDAVVAVFGVPTAHEDDAARAVRAALDVVREVQDPSLTAGLLSPRALTVRVGLNSGEVFVSELPDGQVSVTGDVVNVAARLQSSAPPGEIYAGQSLVELAGGAATFELVGEVVHRGKSHPTSVHRVVREGRPGRRHTTAFHGREQDLASLVGLLERCDESGRQSFVTMVGETGVGKSRLVHELARQRPDALVLESTGHGGASNAGSTFASLRPMLTGLTHDWSKYVRQIVGEEDAAAVLHRLQCAMDISPSHTTPEDVAWAMGRLVSAIARDRSVVLVWDDVHAATDAKLDLLKLISEQLRNHSVLVICLARPEIFTRRPWWGGGPRSSTQYVESLAAADLRAIALDWQARHGGDPTMVEGVVARSDGNPLVLRMLLETRDASGLPVTVHTLFEARLDRLPPEQRSFLQGGAIFGRSFGRDAVAYVLGSDEPSDVAGSADVDDLVAELWSAGVLEEQAGQLDAGELQQLQFSQALLMETAYHSMPRGIRADRHVRAADWLAAHPIGDSTELAVSFHLCSAVEHYHVVANDHDRLSGLYERTVVSTMSALRGQVRRGDPALLMTARGLLGLLADGDDRLLAVVATVWMHRRLEGGDELLRDALSRANNSLRHDAAWKLVRTVPQRMNELSDGDFNPAEALDDGLRVLAALAEQRDAPPSASVIALVYAAQASGQAGRARLCRELLTQGKALARSSGDVGAEHVFVSGGLQVGFHGDDHLDEVIARAEEAREDFAGERRSLPLVLSILAASHAYRGDDLEASRYWDEAVTMRDSLPAGPAAYVDRYHVEIVLAQGRLVDAARECVQAAAEPGVAMSNLALDLELTAARLLLYAGEVDPADERLQAARRMTRDAGDDTGLRRLEGAIAARRGDELTARAALAAMAAEEDESGAVERAFATIDTAVTLLALGNDEQAHRLADQARSTLVEKGAAALAGQVDTWLAPAARSRVVA